MLTEEQRTTLATHIKASVVPDVIAALAGRNDTRLAELYNEDSTFIVWREAISPVEYREAMDWTEVDNMTTGKARIWQWITENMTRAYDATKANIRAGLNDAWNGTTEANLIAISKEVCTVVQEIYATGTGTDGAPGIRVVTGKITIDDVGRALNDNP